MEMETPRREGDDEGNRPRTWRPPAGPVRGQSLTRGYTPTRIGYGPCGGACVDAEMGRRSRAAPPMQNTLSVLEVVRFVKLASGVVILHGGKVSLNKINSPLTYCWISFTAPTPPSTEIRPISLPICNGGPMIYKIFTQTYYWGPYS
ncbi:hypothetical protein BS78_04G090600 [Paspalum vaginatum]|nr:hypothetical protein BS78_04G090600 [Paspalum vaginatum]